MAGEIAGCDLARPLVVGARVAEQRVEKRRMPDRPEVREADGKRDREDDDDREA